MTWWDWYEENFKGYIKNRKYAERLMKWARSDDPEGAREADLAKRREIEPRASAEVLDTRVSNEPETLRLSEEEAGMIRRFDAGEVEKDTDIVEKTLRLVAKMSTDERERSERQKPPGVIRAACIAILIRWS